MDDEGEKNGFSSLESLASDVIKSVGKNEGSPTNVKQTSKVSSERQSASTVTSNKYRESGPGYPGTAPLSARPTSSDQKKRPTGFPAWAVFLVMIGVIGGIYWVVESSRSRVDGYRSLSDVPKYQGSDYSTAKATDSGKAVSDIIKQPSALSGGTDPLDKQGICELQELLGDLGHYTSTVDGISGPGTRRAIAELLSHFPSVGNFEPTTRVLLHAQSKVSRTKSSVRSTTARVVLPRNGQILSRRSLGEAPFKISTSSGVNYYVKLVNISSESDAMTFFVRGGHTAELKVPYGTYSLRYASGKKWYGKTCLFGRNTTFFEADRTLRFYRNGDQIVGHRVELIRQLHGNMDARTISAGGF